MVEFLDHVAQFGQNAIRMECSISDSTRGVEEHLASTPPQVPDFLARIVEYARSNATEPITLPAELTREQRAMVHARATELGLAHKSADRPEGRVIQVWRK